MPSPWTAFEAAYHLGEAYADSQGQPDRDFNLGTLEGVARVLGEDPNLLEATWMAWRNDMGDAYWTEQQVKHARYWLEVIVIGGLAHP